MSGEWGPECRFNRKGVAANVVTLSLFRVHSIQRCASVPSSVNTLTTFHRICSSWDPFLSSLGRCTVPKQCWNAPCSWLRKKCWLADTVNQKTSGDLGFLRKPLEKPCTDCRNALERTCRGLEVLEDLKQSSPIWGLGAQYTSRSNAGGVTFSCICAWHKARSRDARSLQLDFSEQPEAPSSWRSSRNSAEGLTY